MWQFTICCRWSAMLASNRNNIILKNNKKKKRDTVYNAVSLENPLVFMVMRTVVKGKALKGKAAGYQKGIIVQLQDCNLQILWTVWFIKTPAKCAAKYIYSAYKKEKLFWSESLTDLSLITFQHEGLLWESSGETPVCVPPLSTKSYSGRLTVGNREMIWCHFNYCDCQCGTPRGNRKYASIQTMIANPN